MAPVQTQRPEDWGSMVETRVPVSSPEDQACLCQRAAEDDRPSSGGEWTCPFVLFRPSGVYRILRDNTWTCKYASWVFHTHAGTRKRHTGTHARTWSTLINFQSLFRNMLRQVMTNFKLIFHLIVIKLINMAKGGFKWLYLKTLQKGIQKDALSEKKIPLTHAFSSLLGELTPLHGRSPLLTSTCCIATVCPAGRLLKPHVPEWTFTWVLCPLVCTILPTEKGEQDG